MTTVEKLEQLKYRSTKYEIVATDGNRTVFVMYSQKSGRAILDGIRANDFKRLYMLAKTTGTDANAWEYQKGGIACGKWTIKPSGRTQREAVCSELAESIYGAVVTADNTDK